MSSKVSLLLLLGLFLRGANSLSSGEENRKYIARLSDQDPLIDECTSMPRAGNQLNLESVIRAIINGEWERVELVQRMANEACTLELKHDIYENLWLEWQQDKHIYDPFKILDFYNQLNNQSNVPTTLLQKVYQTFVSRIAQLLSMPFHINSPNTEFPLVTKLLLQLSQSQQSYTRDILETLFDAVLTLESPLSVAQRLDIFNASITQLTMANLQLLNRSEVRINTSASTILMDNLRQLINRLNFTLEEDYSLLVKVYRQLPSEIGLLFIAQKVCLRKANNDNEYLYECSGPLNMCTKTRNQEYASFVVKRQHNDANNRTQFAFQNPYWDDRYLELWTDGNVYSSSNIYWLHVMPVQDGVAIYDAATSTSMICGGDPAHWLGSLHYAYVVLAEDFDAHRDECTWIIEDCSY